MVMYVKTVFLENGVFAPDEKQVVLTKIDENSDIAFYPQNQGTLLLIKPRKSTNMTQVSPQQNNRLPKAPL